VIFNNLAKNFEIKENLVESRNIIVTYFNHIIFSQICDLEKFANFPKKQKPNLKLENEKFPRIFPITFVEKTGKKRKHCS
jgi:hypothetical protein